MVRRAKPAAFALAGVVLMHHVAFAQTGVLGGNVSSDSLDRHQVVGADVSIPALRITTRTNFSGEYRIERLPAGRYLVVVWAAGRNSVGDSVTVAGNGETW